MAPLMAIELSKQHSRFPNDSIVVIISPLLYSGYQLSITCDLQRKNDLTKPKKWCASIISTPLPTVCKIYLKTIYLAAVHSQKLSFYLRYVRLAHYTGIKHSLKSINEHVNFVGFFNYHSHAWMTTTSQADLHVSEQIISSRIFLGATDWTIPIKLITCYLTKL